MKRSIEIAPSASISCAISRVISGGAGMARGSYPPVVRGDDEPQADEYHRRGKRLPHRQAPGQDTQLGIGLTEIFDEEAGTTISDKEYAQKQPGFIAGLRPPEEEGEDQKQDDALKPRLVQLTRMAGGIGQAWPDRIGEDDAPR